MTHTQKIAEAADEIDQDTMPSDCFIAGAQFGLSLNASEVERIKSDYEFKCGRNGANVIARDKAMAEVERLRAALAKISSDLYGSFCMDDLSVILRLKEIAKAALSSAEGE